MEEHYQTVQREREFLEDELKNLENDLDYLLWERSRVSKDILRTEELINRVKKELGL
jgi:peptidoglycan hydrolase CwlO-like protein